MQIELATDASLELHAALGRLIPQLTLRKPPSQQELAMLVASEGSSLVIARADSGDIVGTACVSVYRVLTGIRAIIEDVVVDSSARGQGIGEALTRRCLNIARAKGAGSVTLTSNPEREAANRLYLRMGFTRRATNAYVYQFS